MKQICCPNKKEMTTFIVWLQIIFMVFAPNLAYSVPKEQDRAMLEGTERNLLSNPGFEARRAGVTASGGTVALETASPLDGKISLTWDSDGIGQTLESPLFVVPAGMVGATCGVFFKYLWDAGTADDLMLIAHDGTVNIAEINLNPTSGIRIVDGINFPCPTSGSLKWRLESTVANPAIITLDTRFLGSGRNTQQTSQSTIYGTSSWEGSGCQWVGSAASFANYPVDNDCVETTTGKAVASATNVPGIRFNDLPPGKYHVFFSGQMAAGTTTTCAFVIGDGTENKGLLRSLGDEQHYNTDATFDVAATIPDVTYELLHDRQAGAGNCVTSAGGTDDERVVFTVERFPLTNAESLTLETSGFLAKGNIGGSENIFSGVSNSGYTGIEDNDLTLVQTVGSPLQACSGVEESSGLSCSGNESVGFSEELPTAGWYDICFTTPGRLSTVNGAATATVSTMLRFVETPNNAQTIIQSSKAVTGVNETASNASTIYGRDITVCDDMFFDSSGKKTIRLFHSFQISEINVNFVYPYDRSGSNGSLDQAVYFSIKKSREQKPAPIFNNFLQTINSKFEILDGSFSGPPKIQAASISTGATPIFNANPFGHSGVVSDATLGNATWTFGVPFASLPVCNAQQAGSSGNRNCTISSTTNTQVSIRTRDPSTGALDAQGCSVQCMGL